MPCPALSSPTAALALAVSRMPAAARRGWTTTTPSTLPGEDRQTRTAMLAPTPTPRRMTSDRFNCSKIWRTASLMSSRLGKVWPGSQSGWSGCWPGRLTWTRRHLAVRGWRQGREKNSDRESWLVPRSCTVTITQRAARLPWDNLQSHDSEFCTGHHLHHGSVLPTGRVDGNDIAVPGVHVCVRSVLPTHHD